MEHPAFKIYNYRWVILVVFMLVAALNQLIWITFAPVTDAAAAYYHVSQLDIGLLSMSFMIAFLVFSIPASWVIDTYGFRVAVGIGAALTGIFGLMRGIVATNFTLVMIAQIGTAVGQPFILNALTKVAARWFPIEERATASGLGSLAMYLGILAGLALTPDLTLTAGFSNMLLYYGVGALVVGVLFILFAREHPATPPGPPELEERALMFDGMKQVLRNGNFLLLMLIFFIGLGVFNSVTTWIEDIISPRGFTATQAGTAGGLMIVGGIIGALILPTMSDKYRKRVPFILIGLAGTIPGLLGITFAHTAGLLYTSCFALGFFLLSCGPIGFQYGAEIARPTPEGTSNGLLLLMGQISGIAFIFGMDMFRTSSGSMTPSLIVMVALVFLSLFLAMRLRESKLVESAGSAAGETSEVSEA
ncbi:MAG: MFS transporter [Bacteroidetes bacterium]|jgi:sugar phosphate permease|nr:MFS transporter [Bacteroidota bacterium]MCL5033600.1 MFS transporter [Bacteroidota bacterium]